MSKKDGKTDSFFMVEIIMMYATSVVPETVAEKEQSLEVSEEELKQTYLDAAKKVGEAKRDLEELNLEPKYRIGMEILLKGMDHFKRSYEVLADGKQEEHEEYNQRFVTCIKKYTAQLETLIQVEEPPN